jgi:large subunit ribosomal protein L24
MAQKIKKGDTVVVLSGKDKGKTGEVTRVIPKDDKVVVSGVNVACRHRKPSQANPQGGLERKEAPLHVSKVAIADPKSGKPTRVRFEVRDGKKVRVAVRRADQCPEGRADQWLKRPRRRRRKAGGRTRRQESRIRPTRRG